MVKIEFIIYVVKGFFYELLLKGIWALIRGRPFVLRGWQLRNKKAEAGLIFLDHRASKKDLFWNSFASPKDLLLITIASLHTRIRLGELLAEGSVRARSLRILTLDPTVPDAVFELHGKLLGEAAQEVKTHALDAYKDFKEWQSKYNCVEVRKYRITPALQGLIAGGEYAIIEQLTYRTVPDHRVAIYLSKKTTPVAMSVFEERFDDLWNDVEP